MDRAWLGYLRRHPGRLLIVFLLTGAVEAATWAGVGLLLDDGTWPNLVVRGVILIPTFLALFWRLLYREHWRATASPSQMSADKG